MSGNNTPPTPKGPSVREAAKALLVALDLEGDAMVEDVAAYDAACKASTKARHDLADALEQPERSRPGVLPNVELAMRSIEAMKHGEPIKSEGIHAIVELAELGYEELASFDVRWAADMRAVARWREANPGNDMILPDHADLVVWLMKLFDCSFDRPTIDQVDHVTKRLRGAMAMAPNALTKDALELVGTMAESMRKLARRSFIAEERVRQLERATPGDSVLTAHLNALALLTEAKESIEELASIYGSGPLESGDGYRGASALRCKIEAFLALPDLAASPTGADALAYGLSAIVGTIEPESPKVQHLDIKAGHAIRVDFEGRRYEGIAEKDGSAQLKLVEEDSPDLSAISHKPGNG